MSSYLTPLAVCEALFGGIPAIALTLGYHEKSVVQLRRGSKIRDAGDLASPIMMRRLLDHSERLGLGLTAEHLIRGATRAEVDQILATRTVNSEADPSDGEDEGVKAA